MKTYTPSEFRADSSKVYNDVMVNKVVKIDHRDRPAMLLISEDYFNEVKEDKKEKTANP